MKDNKLLTFNKKILLEFQPKKESKFPKYVSPTINFLNGLAGSKTGPAKVGQLSEIFKRYLNDVKDHNSINNWIEYYKNDQNVFADFITKNPINGDLAIENSVDEIYSLLIEFKNNILEKIDKETIKKWVEDLIFDKTFKGMMLEEPIAAFVSKQILRDLGEKFNISFLRDSNKEEESKGIDYIYDDGKNIFLFQIKTTEANSIGRSIIEKQNFIPTIRNDVFLCSCQKNKKDINLIVKKEGKIIYDWSVKN